MKPVEIEFLMKDNLSGGLDKAGLAVDILATKAEQAAAVINRKIAEQKSTISTVESDLHKLENALSAMKPGTAQTELATEVAACRKVLDEERGSLQQLEKEHRQAEQAVSKLRKEYSSLSLEEERAAQQSKTLKDRIIEQKAVIKQIESDIKSLEKAYQKAAPGVPKVAALNELNIAKQTLLEEKGILAGLQSEQEKTKATTVKLTTEMRNLKNQMTLMRQEGKRDTDEYRALEAQAAKLQAQLNATNKAMKILANPNANFQGVISGINLMTGGLSAGMGVLALFSQENENLMKIQTRLQAVMSITIGLQQVSSQLLKSSAFRSVTLVKAKNLLTAANTRLAVSLGISTVAAQALMATLTLGLSVVITGLIIAWNKYSDAQEKAAEKMKERIAIESDGRAQMIKTRFELNSTMKSLKDFTGNKEQEKAKVEELNRKYGESFGYYNSVAEWYDILIQKSDDYIQMLFLQAKAQSLVNKAVEADEKVAQVKATPESDVEGSMNWFAKMGLYMAQGDSYGQIDAQSMIEKHNKEAKEAAIKGAEEQRDAYLEEAAKLQEEAANIGKSSNIGGHVKPKKPDNKNAKKELQAEQLRADKLRKLQIENRQSELDYLKENAEKKRRQIELDYDKEILAAKEKEKELLKLYDKDETGDKMFKSFGTGNVDVLARPLVDAAELVKKGWEDAGEGIATVFSSQFGITDADGKQHEILVTPILPDGTILSPEELETYIDTTLSGATDILAADSKGLVIKVDASLDGNDGELLHQLQEKFYDVPESVLKELSALYSNALSGRDKGLADITKEQLKAEQQALNEYLKEFGTFQQQKLAIAQEYAEKIKKAQEEGGMNSAQVQLLEKQRDVAIQNKETEDMKQNIDWVTVFGEFGGMFDSMIKPALDEAKKYVQTDKFKNSDQASQKALVDAINQMEKSLGGAGGLNFKKLGQDVKTYQNSLLELDTAKGLEIAAITKLKKAQEDNEKALKNGTEEEKQAAQSTLDNAQQNADAASTNVKAQTDIVNANQQNLSTTATNLKANMENVTEGLSKLASGGIKNAYEGLIQTGKAMGGAFEKVADKIEDVPIIGWIISIIDIFKDGLSNLVGPLLDSIFDAISGIFSDVLSGDIFVTIGKSLRDGIGSILNSITYGGWNSWMDKINGSNAKEVNELVDRLTESNEYLITAIEKLTDEMESSGGAQSTEYYRSAYDKQVQKIENDRQMLEAKMGYHSSHHSNDYYLNDDFSTEDWQKASDYVGKTLKSASDLWRLTPEELARLQELPDIWDKINGGKYDQSDWLDAYIADAGTLIELQEQWQDAITDTSFDSIKSGMKELLKDFETDSKDVIASVDEFMKNAILKSIVDGTYSDEIKEWQKMFAEFMSDGILTEEEAAVLRKRYEEIYTGAKAKKDEAFEAAGITDDSSTTQSGKSGSFTAMSQDQGTKLEGMFTSGLNHWVSMDESMENVSAKMDTAENHLAKIEENTGSCKDSLVAIAEDIKVMKRDGLKMRP